MQICKDDPQDNEGSTEDGHRDTLITDSARDVVENKLSETADATASQITPIKTRSRRHHLHQDGLLSSQSDCDGNADANADGNTSISRRGVMTTRSAARRKQRDSEKGGKMGSPPSNDKSKGIVESEGVELGVKRIKITAGDKVIREMPLSSPLSLSSPLYRHVETTKEEKTQSTGRKMSTERPKTPRGSGVTSFHSRMQTRSLATPSVYDTPTADLGPLDSPDRERNVQSNQSMAQDSTVDSEQLRIKADPQGAQSDFLASHFSKGNTENPSSLSSEQAILHPLDAATAPSSQHLRATAAPLAPPPPPPTTSPTPSRLRISAPRRTLLSSTFSVAHLPTTTTTSSASAAGHPDRQRPVDPHHLSSGSALAYAEPGRHAAGVVFPVPERDVLAEERAAGRRARGRRGEGSGLVWDLGVVRQVHGESPGWFVEGEVLVGVRFLVGGG